MLYTAKKIAKMTLWSIVYPAYWIQWKIAIKSIIPPLSPAKKFLDDCTKAGVIARRVRLSKSGMSYNGWILGTKETLQNKKWTLAFGGNGMCSSNGAPLHIYNNLLNGTLTKTNCLYIDGPGVCNGLSLPAAEKEQFITPFAIGLDFLEKGIQAEKIALYGISFGGGVMNEGAAATDWKGKTPEKYMACSDRTFSNLVTEAQKMVNSIPDTPIKTKINPTYARFKKIIDSIIASVFSFLGVQLDSMRGVKALQKANIHHMVIQSYKEAVENTGTLPAGKTEPFSTAKAGDKTIHPEASLYYGIQNDQEVKPDEEELFSFFGSSTLKHMDFFFYSDTHEAVNAINKEERNVKMAENIYFKFCNFFLTRETIQN